MLLHHAILLNKMYNQDCYMNLAGWSYVTLLTLELNIEATGRRC